MDSVVSVLLLFVGGCRSPCPRLLSRRLEDGESAEEDATVPLTVCGDRRVLVDWASESLEVEADSSKALVESAARLVELEEETIVVFLKCTVHSPVTPYLPAFDSNSIKYTLSPRISS